MKTSAPRKDQRRAAHNGPPLGPKWKITDHAVEQYRARVEPECRSHGEAWHRLLTQAQASRHDGRVTPDGDELWLCGDGSALVVKREHHVNVVVTVLARSMVRAAVGEDCLDSEVA